MPLLLPIWRATVTLEEHNLYWRGDGPAVLSAILEFTCTNLHSVNVTSGHVIHFRTGKGVFVQTAPVAVVSVRSWCWGYTDAFALPYCHPPSLTIIMMGFEEDLSCTIMSANYVGEFCRMAKGTRRLGNLIFVYQKGLVSIMALSFITVPSIVQVREKVMH